MSEPERATERRTPIRVVVADDQELVRSGFAMILEAQPDIRVVGEVSDGARAVAAVEEHRPDVALLDVRMPVMDGLEAARRICAMQPTAGAHGDGAGVCKVVMLTTFDIDDYVFRALQAGASGFLLKDVRRDDLVHAVRVVAAGDALLAPAVTRLLIEQFVGRTAAVAKEQEAYAGPARTNQTMYTDQTAHTDQAAHTALARLTGREQETLRLLAKGCSNAEIAARFVVSEHTVKTHVSNVLAKLGLRDRIHAVVFAYESGLVTPGR